MPRRPPASTRDPGGALILAAVADAGIRVRHRVLTDADAALGDCGEPWAIPSPTLPDRGRVPGSPRSDAARGRPSVADLVEELEADDEALSRQVNDAVRQTLEQRRVSACSTSTSERSTTSMDPYRSRPYAATSIFSRDRGPGT